MFFKILRYSGYMFFMRMKALKVKRIEKKKDEQSTINYIHDVYKRWAIFTNKIVGIDIEVEGIENIPEDTCVFMSNHTSIFDVSVLIESIDKNVGFIGKEELRKVPLAGYWVDKGGNVPLNRTNPRDGIKSILKGVANLEKGISMAIFPEGTRSTDGNLLEFKAGSMKLATKSKKPIVPVFIKGTKNLHTGKLKFSSGKVLIVFGKPISTENLSKEEEKKLSLIVYNNVKDLSLKYM